MKKKRDDSVSLSLKVTRIMKITLILILVGVIQVSATTYAQEHRISVSVKTELSTMSFHRSKDNLNLCFSIRVRR